MRGTLKRRKVEEGDYEILDASGVVVARIQEWGKSGYRWHVIPTDKTRRGWDATSINVAVHDLETNVMPQRTE